MKKHQIPPEELNVINLDETEIRTKPAKQDAQVN